MSDTQGEPPPGWASPSGEPPSWSEPGPPPGPSGPPPGQPPPNCGQQQPPSWGQHAPPPGWGQQAGPPGYGAAYGPPAGMGPPAWNAAMKPGIIPLRPLAVGEILDGAFTTIRRYPKATLGLSAIVATCAALIQFVMALAVRNATNNDAFNVLGLLVIIASALISGLAGLILTGMLTVVIGEAVLGRPIDLAEVWSRVRPRILSLIGASILVGLSVLGGLIALVIPGIYLAVALTFTVPVLVLEGQNVTTAMGRSRGLVKGDWWRVLGITILAAIIASIVGGVISLPFVVLSGGANAFRLGAEPHRIGTGALAVQTIGGILSRTVTAPISAGATVLLYIDRRMRREGLDLALSRAAAQPPPGRGW